MPYAYGLMRTLQFASMLAMASAAHLGSNWVLERDNTCAANFNKCPQAGLPGNFCCATGSSCNLLAGGTTVLCCPQGNDCSTIQVISCTISLQDPVANPKAQVKTTELNGKLPVCGKGCCPFGYHCDANNANCVVDKDQSTKPGHTSSSVPSATSHASSTSSAPSATSTIDPSSTAPGEGTSTSTTATAIGGIGGTATPPTDTQVTDAPSPTAASTLNTAAIVGGVVGGLVALSLLVAGLWFLRYKRRKAEEEREKRDTTLSFGNISAPIPHGDYYSQRQDFLAKVQQGSTVSSSSTPTHPQDHFPPHSPYSPFAFRPDSEMGRAPRSHHASAEIGGLRNLTDRYSGGSVAYPVTPRAERLRSGGSESINVFADPSTVGTPSIYNRRDTTWTEFQDHAGQPGEPQPETPVRRRL